MVDYHATNVNIYGTRFVKCDAESGVGREIFRNQGSITIHDTCPSPYTLVSSTQGEALGVSGIGEIE